jgi:hypothetical protein
MRVEDDASRLEFPKKANKVTMGLIFRFVKDRERMFLVLITLRPVAIGVISNKPTVSKHSST